MRVALIGCGNMGHAMLAGWLKAGAVAAGDVAVVEPNDGLRERAAALGVSAFSEPGPLVGFAPGLVVLAVKPQVMAQVAVAYRPLAQSGAAFLSIAAGISVASLAAVLGKHTPILRCMPNMPAAIGKGLMALYAGTGVDEGVRGFAEKLLAANGEVVAIPDEEMMHAVTALSGSGPAYLFHFIECLTQAGVAAGLPGEVAARLAARTVHGSACLADDSTETPAHLREQVTSPNGTTAAALSVLMGEDRMRRLVTEAVEAARARSVELAS